MLYYCLLIIYALLAVLELKKSNTYKTINFKTKTILLLMPMFLLVAFRDCRIGNDTINYYNSFYQYKNYKSISQAIVFSRMEIGYVVLNYLFGKAGLTYYDLQIFISAFIFYSLGNFLIKYCENIPLGCFIFLSNCNMFDAMNIVRSYVALAILLFSVDAINKRNVLSFILFVIIASLFHYSALVFFIIYPVYNISITKKNIIIILTISILALFFAKPMISFITDKIGIYSDYIDRFDASNNIANKFDLLVCICWLFFAVYTHAGKTWDELYYQLVFKKNVYFLSNLSVIVLAFFSVVGLSNNIMSRLMNYFSIYLLILIPHAIDNMRKMSPQYSFNMVVAIILSLLFKYSVIIVFRPEWYNVLPYRFYFM